MEDTGERSIISITQVTCVPRLLRMGSQQRISNIAGWATKAARGPEPLLTFVRHTNSFCKMPNVTTWTQEGSL